MHTQLERSSVANEDFASGSGLSASEFKAAFRNHPGGVALVTARGKEGPVAMTVSSLVSVSAEPPLLAFSLSDLSRSSATIRQAETIVVHLLDSARVQLAKLGATGGIDRFADASAWSQLEGGEPHFHAAPIRILCRIVHEVRAGAATIVIAHASRLVSEPLDEVPVVDAAPLVYHNRHWHALSGLSEIE
jgi:flavin reductase (DIM6/NTAB) family NADH-FMN oxidoreductase RutF